MENIQNFIEETNNKNFSKEMRKQSVSLSVHKILEMLKHPFDEDAVSKKMFESYYNVEGHKYYHMTQQEILDSWKKKANASRKLGSGLDTYIEYCLTKTKKELQLWKLDNLLDEDSLLSRKCKAVDQLLSNFNKLKLKYVMRETPLYFKSDDDFIFNGREDCLFESKDRYILIDWKSSVIVTENKYENMLGPCQHLEECNLNEYTLQIYFYKYFLTHTYGLTDKPIDPYIIEFRVKDDITGICDYYVHRPAFEYNEKEIEKIFNYAKEKYKILNQ